MSALSGILGHFKSEFRIKKVSGNFSDYEERQGGKKSKKKKKKFLKDVFPCGFPISGDKKGEKSKWFFFSVRGEENCEIDYKKKENFFFSFRELFN